jgi:hypothetical protein
MRHTTHAMLFEDKKIIYNIENPKRQVFFCFSELPIYSSNLLRNPFQRPTTVILILPPSVSRLRRTLKNRQRDVSTGVR